MKNIGFKNNDNNMKSNNNNISIINFNSDEFELPKLIEVKIKNKEYVGYGKDNKFPNFLLDLYDNCAEHQSIIDNTVNYTMGSELIINDPKANNWAKNVNEDEQTLRDIMRMAELDYQIFGGYCFKIILNNFKQIIQIEYIPFNFIRVNEDITKAYYSKEWGKWGVEALEYDIYDSKKPKSNTIWYYNGKKTRGTYPIPLYNAALKSIVTSIKISDFHFNNIENNFVASGIINFNGGNPTIEQKEEIEHDLKEKFTGTGGQKLLVSFNEGQDQATTVERLESDDYDSKYESLAKNVQNKIFIAHKITSPSLFGILPENQGFSKTEFLESFSIYSKTVIEPLQNDLCLEFNKLLKNTYPNIQLNIKPFVVEDIIDTNVVVEEPNNNNNTNNNIL